MPKKPFSFSLLLTLIFSTYISALEIVYEPRPPYVIKTEGSLQGLVATPLLKALQSAKIDYELKMKPSKRHLHEIKGNHHAMCAIGWFKNPEREIFARYSDPLYQDRPMGIMTRKDNQQVLKHQNINSLIQDKALSVLTKTSYSYGKFIDEELKHQQTKTREVDVDNIKMLTLIAKKRADYLFISFEEASELLKTHPLHESLQFIPLEGMPEGNARYLICSKKTDPVLIETINAHLKPL